MALMTTIEAAIASLQGTLSHIQTGSGTAKVIVYGGTAPTKPQTAVGGGNKVLVQFNLPSTPFQAPVDGGTYAKAEVDVSILGAITAAADGDATFFRIVNANSVVSHQGAVSVIGGGGDMELSSVSVVTGVDVVVVSLALLQPTGQS